MIDTVDAPSVGATLEDDTRGEPVVDEFSVVGAADEAARTLSHKAAVHA